MRKTKKLFIFGNTDFALMAKEYFQERSEYEVVGFAVDRQYINSTILVGLPVIAAEKCEEIWSAEKYEAFVAIGYKDMNRLREEKMRWLKEKGYMLASYIDSTCSIMSSVDIGQNCFIMEYVVLQPNVKVYDGVCLGANVCVGHEGIIQECAFITIGAVIAGFVIVGKNSFIGANATIKDKVKIAEFTLVGAGGYITKKTTKYGVYLTEHSKNVLKGAENREEAQQMFFT